MKSFPYILFIILSILFQALGGIFGKYAANVLQHVTFMAFFTNVFYIISLGCLFLQAIVWQQALRHYPLSFAYPFMSLTNFFVLFSSAFLFHEGITPGNVVGLVLISFGIAVLSGAIKIGVAT